MINWYYVEGAERIGPVGVETLASLYKNSKIDEETYVWRAGFSNWERLKNVSELNFNDSVSELIVEDLSINLTPVNETISEVSPFTWDLIDKSEEKFYIKTGEDRKNKNPEIYGPYTLIEIVEAFNQKKLNENTYIFSAGMSEWHSIGSISYLRKEFNITSLSLTKKTKAPLFFAGLVDGVQQVFLIKAASIQNAKLLTNKKNLTKEEKTLSLFKGNVLISKNISISVEGINEFEQSINVLISDANDDVQFVLEEFNE